MDVIPIDIHIPKLLDWLISRGYCTKDWQAQIYPIREKINIAIQDMPENKEIAELLSGTYINYFHCCRIVEILKETEADTKNLFGMYGSKRMKDWQEIVSTYLKNNVYLAEAANLLLRTTKYEVPSFRKQIAKAKQIQLESVKKAVEYEKNAASNERERESMRKQFDIEGKNVKTELLNRTSDLEKIHQRIMENIKLLTAPSKYYSKFSHLTTGAALELPLINFLVERGNTTTFEWLYGEAPRKIELPNVKFDDEKNVTEDSSDGDIDWEITTDDNTGEEEIDWGITERENFEVVTLEESGIVVECANNAGGVAKGNEAYNILDNPKTRDEFLAQLLELQSFLKMRLLELQHDVDSLAILNNDLQETVEDVVEMLDGVQYVKNLITDPIAEELHFIKHSRRYIDKIAAIFKQKASNIEKMLASKEVVILRAKEASENEDSLRPKLRLVMEKTRQLQREIEQDISKRYKNRPVHLIGGF